MIIFYYLLLIKLKESTLQKRNNYVSTYILHTEIASGLLLLTHVIENHVG